jgi:hypothetical protein
MRQSVSHQAARGSLGASKASLRRAEAGNLTLLKRVMEKSGLCMRLAFAIGIGISIGFGFALALALLAQLANTMCDLCDAGVICDDGAAVVVVVADVVFAGWGLGFALALLAQLANTMCDLCDAGVVCDDGAAVVVVVADVVFAGWQRTCTLGMAAGAGTCALWPCTDVAAVQFVAGDQLVVGDCRICAEPCVLGVCLCCTTDI